MLASGTKGAIVNTSSFVARAASAGTSAYAASILIDGGFAIPGLR